MWDIDIKTVTVSLIENTKCTLVAWMDGGKDRWGRKEEAAASEESENTLGNLGAKCGEVLFIK